MPGPSGQQCEALQGSSREVGALQRSHGFVWREAGAEMPPETQDSFLAVARVFKQKRKVVR